MGIVAAAAWEIAVPLGRMEMPLLWKARIQLMLLLSIVQTLDAELDRLKRIREIVAELGTPSANLLNLTGVAAFLAGPESKSGAPVPTPAEVPGMEATSVPVPRRKARGASGPRSEPVLEALGESHTESQGAAAEVPEGSEGDNASSDSRPPVKAPSRRGRRSLKAVSVKIEAPPKPAMVVVSATEAAAERASRAARQAAHRPRGEHGAARPQAAPEDLARDLAARWLSGAGSAP